MTTTRIVERSRLRELAELGQSIWYDNIRRALLDSGELEALRDTGVMGVTSNPSIFEKAMGGSADYDNAIAALAAERKSVEEIYETLAIEDIQRTADLFRSVYDETGGADGYVSLEVSPILAHDTERTVREARRLWAALDRPNVMIKVPATPAGIPAIETLIRAGINVNVTLLFARQAYEAVAEAYIKGLEARLADGADIGSVASVASFFVSRVDTAVDEQLDAAGVATLKGKIAIANSKVVYDRSRQIYGSGRWQRLASAGARVQRLLWASTGTKNPEYPDTLYVDQLIGPGTVNTVPPATLNAFLDHGRAAVTLATSVDEAKTLLAELPKRGVDLDAITQQLLDAGVANFAKAFEALMRSVGAKRDRLQADWQPMRATLGPYQDTIDGALAELRDACIMQRIWQHDHTVWKPDPGEITNRLGWLHAPENMSEHVGRLRRFVGDVRAAGYTRALLLGMGGSSLAPEGFFEIFGSATTGYPALIIIDTTDPDMIRDRSAGLDPARTLFIVATKSGGTVETLSAFKYFYNQVADAVGRERAGEHFVAITDPGSGLQDLAERFEFRDTFLNDPNIGGRYSALSLFGLVPAALIGVDVERLLERALTAACNAESANCPVAGDNRAGRLGVMIGELAKAGRDKLTIVTSPALTSFGDWVEQLIAESTGKDDTGILPVVGEPLGSPEVYGDDRVFVQLRLSEDADQDNTLAALAKAGHPVISLELTDPYDVGGQFFLWEMATAVAGARIGIQPFDQPNVEAAKLLARKMVAEYLESGTLPPGESVLPDADALRAFLEQAKAGDYVALQAYVNRTDDVHAALAELRTTIRDRLRLATTIGYGPRFLHSTGQLHKGDVGNGLFVQLTSDALDDLPIPDEAGAAASTLSFGVLKAAQALGDANALRERGRRVIRFDLGTDVVGGLRRLRGAALA